MSYHTDSRAKKNHFSLKISSYLIRVKKQIEPKQKKNRLLKEENSS